MMSPIKAGSPAADRVVGRPDVGGFDHLPVGIVGVARLAETQGEVVKLGAVHHIGHGFGGGTEGDRQHAGRQRVERAAMAAFLRVEPPLQAVDDIGAGQALGLVDDQPAIRGRPRGLRWRMGLRGRLPCGR